MGPGSSGRRFLDWLSGGAIKMAPIEGPYDIIHFPENFEIAFNSPAEALKTSLKDKFPDSAEEIEELFSQLGKADRESFALYKARSFPQPLRWIYSLWAAGSIQKWWGRTTEEALGGLISDPKLRSVLTARWPDHGGRPDEGSFAMEARITNHYMNGAFYPEGGAKIFADSLVPVIHDAGGEVRVKSPVTEILVENGRATGVRLEDGSEHRCGRVVSAIGSQDTVNHLLPADVQAAPWAREVMTLKPSISHLCLFLGLEGDIRAAGATAANHWFHGSWDTNAALWSDPAETEIPAFFVSFPSLKDPKHVAGEKLRHTGQVVTATNWDAFSEWGKSRHGDRPEGYRKLKQHIEEKMLLRFKQNFPEIAPMIVYHELSTPLTMQHYIGRQKGTSYGLATTPERFLSHSLWLKTPVEGLYLAGQDAASPGITGAMMGGVLAAAAIDPRIFRKIL